MPRPSTKRPARRERPDAPDDAKKPMTFRLSEARLVAAQRILGTSTATATIEAALDLVVFRQELVDGVDALFGLEIAPFDDDPP